MAALTFLACNALDQLWNLGSIFFSSGCSFSRSYRIIAAKRRNYLFRKYCLEVWHECQRYTLLENPINISAVSVSGGENKVQQKQLLLKSSENRVENLKFDTLDSAIVTPRTANNINTKSDKMSGLGFDFAAIEASAEAYENQLRREQSEQIRRRSGTGSEAFQNFSDIEVISGEEIDSTFYEYIDTVPVYKNDRIGKLHEGVSYMFTGCILLNCERFSINLIIGNETRDVALHINPRLPQNYIVRNTKVKDVWGTEEVSSALPFSLHRGDKFAVQILVTNACYMISVNGHHFAEYNHRLPHHLVNCIEVKGDVDNVEVERLMANEYPDRLPESEAKDIRMSVTLTPTGNDDSGMDEGDYDEIDGTSIPHEFKLIPMQQKPRLSQSAGLSLPYYGRLPPKSLTVGRCLKIEGRVKLLPYSFYINLQKGQNIWPHAVIALHFNPRFSKQIGALGKHIVCRNAWYDGKWDMEERSELDTDFRPGKTFSLIIACGTDGYEVYVNRKLITEYKYRVKPEIVDTIYVQGDIKLWDVSLVSSASLNARKKIYQNPAYTEDN